MDRLRVALDEVSAVDPGEDIYNPMVGPVRFLVDEPIVRAARAVAVAETVTICATHLWPPLPSAPHTCIKGLPGAPSDPLPEPCSMVERLLVDPGKLQ